MAIAFLGTFLASFFSAAPLVAQEDGGVVIGQVVAEESREGLPTLSVQLFTLPDTAQAAAVLTGFDGRFRLSGLEAGRYLLRISGIGYGTRETEPFEAEAGTIQDFGTIALSMEAVAVAAITVESQRAAVTYEADRTGYVVDALPGAEGGSVSDALRAVPDLDVDIEGRIEVRGEAPAIWIDGRPAPVSGESLAQFLDQFPADLIDRIEVIDAPGAEFDAEGAGGIVNIVLKEGVDLGVSGSVFANAGTRGNSGTGGRATLQRGDWVWNANASLRRRDTRIETFNLRENLASDTRDVVERTNRSASASLGGNLGLRAQWRPRDEFRWNFRLDAGGQDGERDGLRATTFQNGDDASGLRLERADLQDSDDRSVNLRSDLQWRFDDRHHRLDAEVRWGTGRDRRARLEELLSDAEVADEIFADEVAFIPAEVTLDDRESREREFRLDLDYRRPLGERLSFRTGLSARQDRNDDARVLTLVSDPSGATDPEVAIRGFSRDARLASGYLTLLAEPLEGLSLQAGVRAEQLDWDLDFPGMDPFSRRYLDLFPSANLSWRIDRDRRIRLSYNQRVGRPGVSVLDPTDRSTDPLERNVGNPDLDPRITHRVNLNASWTFGVGTLSAGPWWNRTRNGWERVTSLDDTGVTTRSWENLSTQSTLGGSVNFSFRGLGSWRGSANLRGSRSWRDADGLAPGLASGLTSNLTRTTSSWTARLNANGTLAQDLTMQASARYRAARRSLQGRDGSQVSADVSFRYRFLDRRGSISLSLRDPLALRQSDSEIRTVDFFELRESSRSVRSAQLSVTWNFGGRGARRGGGR